jgi:hypothetical protein
VKSVWDQVSDNYRKKYFIKNSYEKISLTTNLYKSINLHMVIHTNRHSVPRLYEIWSSYSNLTIHETGEKNIILIFLCMIVQYEFFITHCHFERKVASWEILGNYIYFFVNSMIVFIIRHWNERVMNLLISFFLFSRDNCDIYFYILFRGYQRKIKLLE